MFRWWEFSRNGGRTTVRFLFFMTQGKARFDTQIGKIQVLFNQAQTKENPALWLFLHDLRTPMFMLESLGKIYAELIDKKFFTGLRDSFKQIEDALGALDYYAAYQKEFARNATIQPSVRAFISAKTVEKTQTLGLLLKNEGWLDGSKLKKINKQLETVKWLSETKEIAGLRAFYVKQIGKIKVFVAETTFEFDNVEEDVHELRRKLRWLSIYPQALQGMVKLEEVKPVAKHLKKYLTPEIVNSRFNQLTVAETQKNFLVFSKNHFLALSWMISELGNIKDNGLRLEALKNAIQETELLNDESAGKKALEILGKNYPEMPILLKQASEITKQYFDEDNLNQLLTN
jgi:hypothetical protein